VLITVANASGPQGDVRVDELSWDYMLEFFEFFARSPLALLQAALPHMRAAGWGQVIHIGSDLFHRGEPGWSSYMAAKGALLGLTRGWAIELGRDGITVNLVAPGWIPVERHGAIPAEIEERKLRRQPIPRWGTPDDVASAVSYLVSDGAGFVSGQRIVVNGGFHFV
jgi:NAD(P)-dependent dehydrogenase (short-subunit alcohol dehydrogenase family)